MNHYKMEYLQTFKNDLKEIVRYISVEFDNKIAAHQLLNRLEKKIELLKTNLEIFQFYDFVKPLKRKYRYFVIGNHITFYYVDVKTKIVVIYRIIYRKRNMFYI